MVEVTEADRQLSALIIKCSEVEHGSKLIATHREAAAKAATDRLLQIAWSLANAAGVFSVSSLAAALEGEQHVD